MPPRAARSHSASVGSSFPAQVAYASASSNATCTTGCRSRPLIDVFGPPGRFQNAAGADPKTIQTEVFLLPAAFFMEKNGTITNSGGLVQWRNKAVVPPGKALPDGEVVDYVFRRVRDLVHESRDPKDDAIKKAAENADNRPGALLAPHRPPKSLARPA